MLEITPATAAQTIDAIRRLARQRAEQEITLTLALETARLPGETWTTLLPALKVRSPKKLTAYSAFPAATVFPAPTAPEKYAVVATDGSQIVPDRHDGFDGIGLIHASRIRISYGAGERAVLDSATEIFFDGDDEDSEPGSAGRLALRRLAAELEHLADLAEKPGASLALTDGSLIFWSLGASSAGERDTPEKRAARASVLSALERFQAAGVPVAGYVSGPGSRDVVNGLAEARALTDSAPLSGALPTDAALFQSFLKPGERSPVFTAEGLPEHSFPHILSEYGPHWIAFFYLNAGEEIARIEIPAWVASDPDALNLVHALCLDQARKGRGYPVALAEAHEKAVVREPDRRAFLNHLTRVAVESGLTRAVTRKALAKRARTV